MLILVFLRDSKNFIVILLENDGKSDEREISPIASISFCTKHILFGGGAGWAAMKYTDKIAAKKEGIVLYLTYQKKEFMVMIIFFFKT